MRLDKPSCLPQLESIIMLIFLQFLYKFSDQLIQIFGNNLEEQFGCCFFHQLKSSLLCLSLVSIGYLLSDGKSTNIIFVYLPVACEDHPSSIINLSLSVLFTVEKSALCLKYKSIIFVLAITICTLMSV